MSTITDDRMTTQTISGIGNLLKLTKNASVIITGDGSINFIGIRQSDGSNKVVVDGVIRVILDGGATGSGITSYGDHLELVVNKTGEIHAGFGVSNIFGKLSLTNWGEIISFYEKGYVVGGNDLITLHNNGSLIGYDGVAAYGGSDITNEGTIIASHTAFVGSNDEIDKIDNFGTMKTTGPVAIDTGRGDDRVMNAGKIIGDVVTGDDDDTVIIRGGSIKGDIITGLGNDTLITNSARYQLLEGTNGGYDIVKSSVSYALSANVETLVLLGRKNINATGNDSADNYLYGNAGNNVLRGLDGYNELFGKGGHDTLIGSAGFDLFGIGKHYGHDTVKNFQDGLDEIDIFKLGVDTYDQLKPHIRQHGDDTWIAFGNDVLILEDIDRSALDASDFTFNY